MYLYIHISKHRMYIHIDKYVCENAVPVYLSK